MVTLEPQLIKSKIAFGTTNGFSEAESAAFILVIALVKTTTHCSGITNLTPSHTTTKDETTNLVVKIGMEGKTLILAQPEPITTLATIAPTIPTTIINPRVDVKLEEIEAVNMEE
jgi:hypothetical protein